jgi:Ca2+-binding EF-hand superfamily protein
MRWQYTQLLYSFAQAVTPVSIIALALLVMASAGCWKESPVVKAPPVRPVAKARPTAALPVVPAKPAEATASESPIEPVPVEAVVPAEATVEPNTPPKSLERILLLTPVSPLLVELELSIDGRPHAEALEQLVDQVLQIADTDRDERTTWQEITTSPRFLYGQFGNLAIDGNNGPKQIIDLYDIDRDGIVDHSELPRFLTRNSGGSRSFSIRGTADYRHSSRNSPTWEVLDADGDGVLASDEIAGAALRLRSRDTDDDEALVPADFSTRLSAMTGRMERPRRRRGIDAAKLLGEHANWDSVRLSLEEIYAFGGRLTADCFPLAPDLFSALDANGDGVLGRGEFQRLNEAPPQLRLAVNFGQSAADDAKAANADRAEDAKVDAAVAKPAAKPAQLRLLGTSDALAATGVKVSEQAGRYTLQLANMKLSLYVNDTLAGNDHQARAEQSLAMYDGDKNGYLEASEIPAGAQAQFGRIEVVDTDGDGKVYPGEIAAFLLQQQAAMRSQIHAKAGDREDSLFAAIDTNDDDRLDAREIAGAASALLGYDRNGDGAVSDDEVPAALMLGLARGSLENADVLFTPPPVSAQGPAADAPRWFTAMDTSGDGVISRREFLGTAEQYSALDQNGDDFLELAEALPQDESECECDG